MLYQRPCLPVFLFLQLQVDFQAAGLVTTTSFPFHTETQHRDHISYLPADLPVLVGMSASSNLHQYSAVMAALGQNAYQHQQGLALLPDTLSSHQEGLAMSPDTLSSLTFHTQQPAAEYDLSAHSHHQ
jgi:hypothetical protein